MAALRSADAAIRRASADAALRRTSPAKYRLAAGFLAGLPGAVREIASMLTDPDVADAAAQSLHRLADTGRSLGLSDFADAAEHASTRLRAGDGRRALAEVVLAIDQLQIAGPFAPIAVLGTARTVAGLRAQDDGSAEPLRTFETLDALRDGIAVDWPQALIVPASVGPEALTALCARAPVFVVGVARDEQARLMAAAAGAAGFLGEPLTLPAVLAQVRYAGVARRSRCVAVLGDEAWSRAAIESLNASGLEALRAEGGGTAAVLHGVHPAAVVFGPGTTPETVRTARQHLGRGNVALVAVDSGPSADALRAAGVDDVVEPNAALPLRVLQRIERFEDHRRDRDELTSLPNRPSTLESMHRWLAWSARTGVPLAAVLIFAEGLGEVQAAHGHEAANACRRQLAAALERGLRRHDLVGVLSPDLFLAVLTGCRTTEAERRMIEIRTAFEARIRADRRLRDVALAVGVTDTAIGVPGLLPRALAALDASRAAAT